MKSKIRMIQLLFVLLVGLFILFTFNGMAMHPIKEAVLSQTFLDKVHESGLQNGEVVKQESHENSTTFLFKNEQGELACATYSKSIYSNKWKEEKYYTSKMSVFNNGEVSYEVNDKLTTYQVTCIITDEPEILFGERISMVLSVKTFGMGVILLAICLGRSIGNRLHRR